MRVRLLFPALTALAAPAALTGQGTPAPYHVGAMATGLLTTANPALLGRRLTEGYVTQPNLLG
ncbi:MAG: hypothetical protein P3C09_07660, partial [Gemmatimonadota bacterium]|nr:hypothetical protein [Gemmatimonadota bacterium]